MGSLNALFDLSRAALAANQAALNATANNVSNQNTVGYTREVANFSSGDVVTLSVDGAAAQTSTPTVSVSSTRDRVLEARVQQQMQLSSSTSAQSDALGQIQDVFAISSTDGTSSTTGSTALGTALDGFFSSLTALAGNPADAPTQQAVLTAAQSLASTFNSSANQLQQVNSSLNSDIANTLPQVNALAQTVASLNRQISETSPNADAGQLEDQRQTAIEQLSQLVGLDQIQSNNNTITLTTQGGTVLVEGATASALTAETGSGTTKILDSSGHDVTAGVQGGSIGGQLAAQSSAIPAAENALDALAYRVATAVNAQNKAGFTASGANGTAIFAVGSAAAGSAAGITVLATSPSAIASAGNGEGPAGNTNATALAGLVAQTDAGSETMDGNLEQMLAQIGSSASTLAEQTTTQQATLTQLTTQRDAESGVSLDTEAANLTLYQKSYQAAAQLLTVLNQLMASSINLGQETTVT